MSAAARETEPPQLGALTRLLPVAVIAAAICLFASELMTVFDFRPQGGESLCTLGAGDRHSNAQMVIAVFSVIALVAAVYAGSRPAAFAVAAMGIVALLIFLISDLRVANAVGTLSDSCGTGSSFFDAKAIPQGGFYLELAGSVALTISGIALATLTPPQLDALRPPRRSRPSEPRSTEQRDEPPVHGGERKGRLGRAPRTRQRG